MSEQAQVAVRRKLDQFAGADAHPGRRQDLVDGLVEEVKALISGRADARLPVRNAFLNAIALGVGSLQSGFEEVDHGRMVSKTGSVALACAAMG